ncbi:hypothetical protein ACSFBI_05030 [Variovorax sp. RB3P1]|uniref:hypothetical protein n=1 Tax=Variovorax sp. RB3P1 TaxID=3443732 RepID=UPI003F465B64
MATATQDTKAQDTNKAPAHGKAPTKFNKERFDELHNRDDLTDAEEEEYSSLRKLRGESAKARKTAIAALVEQMTTHGITFVDLKEAGAPVSDIDKLFDANTIKLAAGSGAPRAARKTAAAGETKTREGNIQHNGQKYNWTRNLDDAAKLPLFEAFKAGKSVKAFFVKPDDKAASARLIARLEREAAADGKKVSYSEANLTELGLTRESIKAAIEAKDKADKAKAAK